MNKLPSLKRKTEKNAATRRLPVRLLGLRALSGFITFVLVLGALLAPSGFVLEGPGPMVNVLGAFEGQTIITVGNAPQKSGKGELNMTTVSVSGGPYNEMSGVKALYGWFAPDGNRYQVLPTEAAYPKANSDEVNAASSAQMADSQTQAKAAAARYLKLDVVETVSVLQTIDGGPAAHKLQPEDRVLKVNDTPVTGVRHLSELVQHSNGQSINVTVLRGEQEQSYPITPVKDEESGKWRIGIAIKQDYEIPADIDYDVEQVGGPSAGLMLALGTIEKLSERGLLADGERNERNFIAGTGTIDANGKVGPIGGVKYKIMAAGQRGVRVFLVPRNNCSEVLAMQAKEPELLRARTANGPQEMKIIAVEDLSQAVQSLETVRDKGIDAPELSTCQP